MDKQTISIIKATAPILKSKGEEITTQMYFLLFNRYPEVKELFKNAGKDQYKKLANAVYAYAANIDKLENLEKSIATITSKHVETNIKPEHYPLVGECLIQAIKDVLKDDATKEVIDAWSNAYTFLADVFIAKEKGLYEAK
ncbi:MAG: Flavohemoprotein (Hemoglobin-like protein) (Flavohemoglobin) (Nitric oxide dioxygenase) (EC [uncultured Campylobacterales bacterium]|uniref:Flavohemoprotein (Hemoglobin-like protein) (Flavohemoglobin) (Nitric oxide dioxygenase) (EC) n=1 Tax=uncultured Campylobacterales bacterium TaxID=352960 RepID=A0A6S6SZA2_9BACT|nr:MAG: Flavohemoprotein (Hemoglobin-like protein) (Flavohemoglobin) (Nitric oxide dioxygenase) (EC [uncultured Campylobacterales bacterium]